MYKQLTRLFLCTLSIVVAAAVLVPPQPASAQDAANAKWIVTEISGHARERGPGSSWVPLSRGSVLIEGRTVETGPDARLVLMHDEDLVTVSPNSVFDVPHNSDPAVSIRFIQKLGTMLFRVEHLPRRRFEVDAPYLAAVVKGTVFTVNATKAADAVHVAEGAVQVSTLLTHQVALILPGEVALVSTAGRDLTIQGAAKASLLHKSKYDDPADDALGTGTADAADALPQSHEYDVPALTKTIGDQHLDISAVSKGLLNRTGHENRDDIGNGFAASGNPNAAGGNPNAAGGNFNVGSESLGTVGAGLNGAAGNPGAGGGNPNAAAGNPFSIASNAQASTAHGGNPNAGGGNPHAPGAHGKP